MTNTGRAKGFSLLEALVALGLLASGLTSVIVLLGYVQGSNRNLAIQSHAIDAFARVGAEIRDARCDFSALSEPYAIDDAMTDPGLRLRTGTWIATALPGSSIRYVGDAGNNPQLASRVPPIRIDYRVLPGTEVGVPALDIDVRVREITRDPLRDDPDRENGYWIRIQGIKKICNPRLDDDARGEF